MSLRIAEEVRVALAEKRGVVALETSVVAQGLPAPHNLDAARACEAAVRRAGAVPATIGVIDGDVFVGLDSAQLERLANPKGGHLKIGARDLAIAEIDHRTGGTTVSATCEIAARAGLFVFSTGGIGGVHRGVAETLDVSQDLLSLSRSPVAVVCAGAKSVLDLPKTLELLETLAVPVIGVGSKEFPAFYTPRSGLTLEHSVTDAAHAARVCHARFDSFHQGGVVFALAAPEAVALGTDEVEALLADALKRAHATHVTGKDVTPFLLAHLAQASGGRTLRANVALLEHNASFAGALAAAYASTT